MENQEIKYFSCLSSTCDEKLPVARSLAEAGKLEEALELLSGLEKQTRTGCDTHSTTIVQLCYNTGTSPSSMQ